MPFATKERNLRASSFLSALAALGMLTSPTAAQTRSVTIGIPSPALSALVDALAPAFLEQTGFRVKAVTLGAGTTLPAETDAALFPDRAIAQLSLRPGAKQRPVFRGDAILIGSRAERARVRGLRDIQTALRWIAAARGTYVASSPQLGLRDFELSLWARVGVDVRTRLTWYVEIAGDEAAVLRKAGDLGGYALVERSTFAGVRDRRGLEVLVAGDPLLQTTYSSVLLRPDEEAGRAWHEWLGSGPARAAIEGFRLNGTEVFWPLGSDTGKADPQPNPS